MDLLYLNWRLNVKKDSMPMHFYAISLCRIHLDDEPMMMMMVMVMTKMMMKFLWHVLVDLGVWLFECMRGCMLVCISIF